jgi:hypothetical protein
MGAQTGKWPLVKIQKYRNIFPDFWSRLPLTVGF